MPCWASFLEASPPAGFILFRDAMSHKPYNDVLNIRTGPDTAVPYALRLMVPCVYVNAPRERSSVYVPLALQGYVIIDATVRLNAPRYATSDFYINVHVGAADVYELQSELGVLYITYDIQQVTPRAPLVNYQRIMLIPNPF